MSKDGKKLGPRIFYLVFNYEYASTFNVCEVSHTGAPHTLVSARLDYFSSCGCMTWVLFISLDLFPLYSCSSTFLSLYVLL